MAAAMDQTALSHPGPALLAAEATVHYGPVPMELCGQSVPPGSMRLQGDGCLLRTTTGYALHYTKGHGVTIDRAPDADPAEESLWLNGSIYAAIAAIHGYLPFHASAVVWQGRVYAFSGPSGAGKSTLSAALGQHGLPLLCDDTLVLDVVDPKRVLCLPGHKRLKLTAEAIELTRARQQEKVDPVIEKFYAEPPGGIWREVLPLAELLFLHEGDAVAFTPITGAERIGRINDDHYTADLFAAARGEDLSERFARIARIASEVSMHLLVRPMDGTRFAETTKQIAAWIKGDNQP